ALLGGRVRGSRVLELDAARPELLQPTGRAQRPPAVRGACRMGRGWCHAGTDHRADTRRVRGAPIYGPRPGRADLHVVEERLHQRPGRRTMAAAPDVLRAARPG